MDRSSIIGLALGMAAVMGGNALEGGHAEALLQPAAAAVVFGGTAGAVLLSYPFSDIVKAVSSLVSIFFGKEQDPETLVQDIVRYAGIARKSGFIALEPEIPRIANPFLRKAVSLAVDGLNPNILRETMEQEMATYEDEKRRIARVFDTAGGFAPTIGIIGAVLGLVHVMQNLSDPSQLGSGIAVSFVATIYGVGSANLFLLPVAKKLVNRLNHELSLQTMIMEGILGIESGMNSHYLEERIRSCVEGGSEKRTAYHDSRRKKK